MDRDTSRDGVWAAIADATGILVLLVSAMIAAGAVAVAAGFVGHAGGWPWFVWLVVSPVLYLAWLVVFLAVSALSSSVMTRRFPKPRYLRLPRDGQELPATTIGAFGTLNFLYRRADVVESLPLVPAFTRTRWLRALVLRSYAPSTHLGANAQNWGYLYDPDLTFVGDDVVIGGRAAIAAHSATIRRSLEEVYVSAPVRIGNRATIGGEARVALGCEIGEDAVIEPGAVVPAFTRVPSGEVWGGNPARFRRMRDDSGDPAATTGAVGPVGTADGHDGHRPDTGPTLVAKTGRVPTDDARVLVISALNLADADVPDDLSSAGCSAWDSLGQIAIAMEIFDRHGVVVDEADIYRIRTLQDVVDVVAGRQPGATRPADAERPAPSSTEGAAPVPAPAELADAPAIPEDLELLPLLDPREATRGLAARFEGQPASGTPLRVVIAATFTAQPIAGALRLWGAAYGLDVDCRFADFSQVVQTLLDAQGPFALNPDGVNVVLSRPEDFALGARESATAQLDQVFGAIAEFVSTRNGGGQLLVGTLPPVVSAFATADPDTVTWLRHEWLARLQAVTGATPFDFARVVEHLGIDAARSSSGEVLLRAPYAPQLFQDAGIALARQIRTARRSPAKVIAVDCDNTLWGGVVGEVGIEGIEVGPDGPGRAFQLFQQYLKELKARGLLLAVVSRNEERDVLDVFERHPGMILRPDDIASWSVNWNHKSENLRALAEEMNLGIDAFVFLDDDPAVRHEVASRLPDVHVVPLPEEPARYCETLSRLWLFDGARATAVDAARTRMMQEEGRRKRELRAAASLGQFLASLELRVEMGPPSDAEWPRVAQLTQRTNQFSLSLKRRTLDEVRNLGPGVSVLALKASDRFGDYGLVGVGMLRPGAQPGDVEVDTLLMSCRALGRGVEDAFLYGLAELAAGQGGSRLVAPFVPGPRNAMIKDYLVRTGFREVQPDGWVLGIEPLPPLPAHVNLVRAGSAVAASD